jgi:predicted SAM-dependent methyltransferase
MRIYGDNMKLTLNIGSGERTYKEYPPKSGFKCVNYDERDLPGHTDVVGDVRKLPWEDEHFDYLLCSDILEHFPIRETPGILKEWLRVLKTGGIVEFRLPNLEAICEDYLKRKDENRGDMENIPIAHYFSWLFYGAQSYKGNYHYVGFDRRLLRYFCEIAGLEETDWKKEGYNMVAKYIKK